MFGPGHSRKPQERTDREGHVLAVSFMDSNSGTLFRWESYHSGTGMGGGGTCPDSETEVRGEVDGTSGPTSSAVGTVLTDTLDPVPERGRARLGDSRTKCRTKT